MAPYYYNPWRPIIIALIVILMVFLVLSCVRRRRAQLALRQQHALQATPYTELGDMYVYQYPPPQGSPMTPISSPYAPPPPGQQPYSYQPSNLYAPPPLPPANAYSAYPPMPVPPPQVMRPDHPPTATSNSPQYVPAQDGSAFLPTGFGQLPAAATAVGPDGVPTMAPPPYTAGK
ncbi:hypothetical protein BGZ82_003108 [Podila clonocystis]|nr:hypothetical protein BGZ82_003108 [Podila clonocystis]